MVFLKKFFVSFLLFTTLFVSVFARPALAQGNAPQWYHSDFKDWYLKVSDPNNPEDIFGERYTSAQVEWVFYGVFAFVFNSIFGTELGNCIIKNTDLVDLGFTDDGIENTGPGKSGLQIFANCPTEIGKWLLASFAAITYAPEGQYYASENNGFIGKIFLDDRPISGISYVRNIASKFTPIQEVQAQSSGFGFGAAVPVRELWAAARNISYFLIIIALIVMAFMVMFRVKNSPQTVITIQSVLPKLIVGIILITFSYAIAGLMIDLMYVVIGVLASVLASSGLFASSDWTTMYNSLSGATTNMLFLFRSYSSLFSLSFMASGFGFVASIASLGIIPLLLTLVLNIILFIIVIKVAWALIKNFISILLIIATGPFAILGGAIGGSGISGWLKNLAAHLAVYPAVGFLLAISFLFLGNSMNGFAIAGLAIFPFIRSILILIPGTGGLQGLPTEIPFEPNTDILANTPWVPPFTNVGGNLNVVWLAASMITLSLIPKVSEIIQSAISGKPFAYGSAIGAPVAAAAGMAAYPFAPVGQVFEERYKNFINNRLGTIGGIFQDIFKTKR